MKKETRYLLSGGAISLFLLLLFAVLCLPRPLFDQPTSYVIEDRQGVLLSAAIAEDGQWRFPAAEEVPENFLRCLTAYEDKRFYYHPGIDFLALGRALYQNITQNRIVSGASTLSMQVVRMSRNQPRNWRQKIYEIYLTIGLELRYSKESILKLYAANAPFGSNVVGLEAASWRYFGRTPETLSWAESATLAVLPNAPSLIHPGKNRDLLLSKRNALLDRLADRNIIDQEMAELSKMEPLPEKPFPLPQFAPHLLARFRSENREWGRQSRLQSTLDAALQTRVQEILQRHHLRNRSGGILNAAALVLEVDRSETLAYVGNIQSDDAETESYVDMIRARRSPGSTLKPFLYAGMLHDGLLLPHTLVADIPTQIGGFTPQNFDLAYDGAVPASAAVSRSLNIPTVKMLQQYRYPRFYNLMKRLGITTLDKPADHYGLAMVLGGAEVTMWDLAAAYANLARTLKHYGANQGLYNPMDYHAATYIHPNVQQPNVQQTDDLQTDDLQTDDPHRDKLQPTSILDFAAIHYTFQAMNEVSRPESEAHWEQFSSSRKIAWKTGTSFGFRDGWAIGLTPNHVVCVWVGNADGEGRPGLTGIQTAAPILFEIFALLPVSDQRFEVPANHLIQTEVCSHSGHLAGPYCPAPENTYIPASGYKSSVCPYHRVIHIHRDGKHRVSRGCVPESEFQTASWFVLPPAMEYYFKKRNPAYRELPPFLPGCEPTAETVMEMIYPRNHAKIYIPLELDGNRGRVIFTAAHQQSNSTVYWHLNNEFVGETTHTHQLALNIAAGNYELTLVDQAGNRLTRHLEVLEKQD